MINMLRKLAFWGGLLSITQKQMISTNVFLHHHFWRLKVIRKKTDFVRRAVNLI